MSIKYYGYHETMIDAPAGFNTPCLLENELKKKLPMIIDCFLEILSEYNLHEDEFSLIGYLSSIRVLFSPIVKSSTYSKSISIEEIKKIYNETRDRTDLNDIERHAIASLGNIIPILDRQDFDIRDIKGMLEGIIDHFHPNEMPEWLYKIVTGIGVFTSKTLGEYHRRKPIYIILYPNAIQSRDINDYYRVYAHEIFHAIHYYLIYKRHPKFVRRKNYDAAFEGLASFFEYYFSEQCLRRTDFMNDLKLSWNNDPNAWPYAYACNFLPNHKHLYSLIYMCSLDNMRNAVATLKQINECNKLLYHKP